MLNNLKMKIDATSKRILSNPLSWIFIHLVGLTTVFFALDFLGIFSLPTNSSALLQWDAWWYKSIVDKGYSYVAGQQSNVAFYPLFPYLWKLLGGWALKISLVNIALFSFGMMFLQQAYNFRKPELLLLLSIPSLFFCYVPYSEAVFFFSSSMLLYGLRKNYALALVGIFLASLTRSASLIFIPIVIFQFIIEFPQKPYRKIFILKKAGLILSTSLATLLVQIIQYPATGSFFTIFDVQQNWNRILSIPVLNLTTWDGYRLIWLDGLALLCGVLAAVGCAWFLVFKLKKSSSQSDSSLIFSIAYITIVSITTLLYSSEDALGGTSIYSLNRFVFATPYLMVGLIYVYRNSFPILTGTLVFICLAVLTWLLFSVKGFFDDRILFKIAYYCGVTLYAFVHFIVFRNARTKQLWAGLYLVNVFLQLYLLNAFMAGKWIG